MRTYVKIEAENVEPIVQKLARLAVDFSDVCVWDINLLDMGWTTYSPIYAMEMGSYFGMDSDVAKEHCDRIISKSGADLEDANIYFEWYTPPSDAQLRKLRKLIEGALKPYGNKYTITNKD